PSFLSYSGMISLADKRTLRSSELTIGGYVMNNVRQLLQDKGYEVLSIEPDKSVYDAMQLMTTRNIGALLVLEAGKLIGIITERDFSRNAEILDKPLRDVQVEEIMTRKVVFVGPDNTIEDCMRLVTKMRIRHLPVMENDQIIGMISIGDLIKDTISDQEFVIDHLERYIYEIS
ncbi:MAG: CBS domain-containing protein, partial [Nitrosomonadaceae bacterium]